MRKLTIILCAATVISVLSVCGSRVFSIHPIDPLSSLPNTSLMNPTSADSTTDQNLKRKAVRNLILLKCTPSRYQMIISRIFVILVFRIFAGEEHLDCALILSKLWNLFGIERLMLAGGGLISFDISARRRNTIALRRRQNLYL